MHYIAEPAEPEACSGEKLNFSLENWVIPIEVATYAPLSNFSVVDEIFFMVSSLILIFISLYISARNTIESETEEDIATQTEDSYGEEEIDIEESYTYENNYDDDYEICVNYDSDREEHSDYEERDSFKNNDSDDYK